MFFSAKNFRRKAAYDYHATVVATRTKQQVTKCCPPFGEQLTLVEPTDKVTENFTGKGIRGERCDSRVYSSWHCRAEEHCAQRNEKDDEIELNYFGARYLDPMLGLWVSVDAARQFASPYLYVGNRYNPIVSFDEDGNAVPALIAGVALGVGCGAVFDYVKSRMSGNEFKYSIGEALVDGVAGVYSSVRSLGVGALAKPLVDAAKSSIPFNVAAEKIGVKLLEKFFVSTESGKIKQMLDEWGLSNPIIDEKSSIVKFIDGFAGEPLSSAGKNLSNLKSFVGNTISEIPDAVSKAVFDSSPGDATGVVDENE